MKNKLYLIFLLTSTSLLSYSQDKTGIEKDLLKLFHRIEYWSENPQVNYDSLGKANQDFMHALLGYTDKYAFTIRESFPSLLQEGLLIATAPDNKLRIYSWDTGLGGTMRDFSAVYQYRQGDKTYSGRVPGATPEEEPQDFYSHIYQLEGNQRTYYIAICHAIYSTKDAYQGVKIFSIENGQLNSEVKLIKTSTGIRNELGFAFDFFSVVDRPERPVKLINYDPSTKTITIPVVHEDGRVTKKWIKYRFNGQYFEKNK